MAKRGDNTATEWLEKPEELFALQKRERDGEIIMLTAKISPNEKFLQVSYKPTKEEPEHNSSLAVAAWTTSLARVRLNKVLQKYPDQVISADTGLILCPNVSCSDIDWFADSVFLLMDSSVEPPEAPGSLGMLKDELETSHPGKGARITSWRCTGPKSYSYVVTDRDGKVLDRQMKMKGVSLQSRVELDHEKLDALVRGGQSIQVPQTQFKKNISAHSVAVNDITKKVSFTSNKRVLLHDSDTLDTLPYGHAAL